MVKTMIRVLLVDNNKIIRDGSKQILADTTDIQALGEAAGHEISTIRRA